jgi:hypothetical protein
MEFKIIEKIEKHENFEQIYMESLHVCKNLKDDKMKTYCHGVCKNNCYAKQKQYFEQYVAFVRNPEAIYVERQSNSEITYIKPPTMLSRYASHSEFLNVWLRDIYRSTYQRPDFLPNNKDKQVVPKDVFNIFHSYAVQRNHKTVSEAKRKELIKPIIQHFDDLFEKDVADYLINYFACFLQYPERKGKNSVAIIIQGDQGDGKSFTIDTFMVRLIGENLFTYTCKPGDLFDDHSEGMTNKLIVNLDEVTGKSTFDMSDILKSFTTQVRLTVNPKGIRPYKVNNFCIYFFTTNNPNPLKIELGDRRYFATRTKQTHKNDKAYFAKMDEYMSNPEVLSAWYDYLMSLDVENIDFTATRPNSGFYQQMVEASLPNAVKFIDYLITEYKKENKVDTLQTILPEVLFTGYKKWKEEVNIKDDHNLFSFGRALTNIRGIKRKHTNTGNLYLVDCVEIINYFKEHNIFGYTFTEAEKKTALEDKQLVQKTALKAKQLTEINEHAKRHQKLRVMLKSDFESALSKSEEEEVPKKKPKKAKVVEKKVVAPEPEVKIVKESKFGIAIKFRFHKKHADKQNYTNKEVDGVVDICKARMQKMKLKIGSNNFNTTISQSKNVKDTDLLHFSNGFTIIFDNCICDQEKKEKLFEKVKSEIIEQDVFKEVPFIDTYEQIVNLYEEEDSHINGLDKLLAL